MQRAASRRPRVARRALDTARRAPVAGWARERVDAVLAECTPQARRIVALILIEHLSPIEAAAALGLPVAEVRRTYRVLLARLRRRLRAVNLRPTRRESSRPRLVEVPLYLRRAS